MLNDILTKLSIAEGSKHDEESTNDPDDDGEIYRSCWGQDSCGGHKDPGANDAADDDGAAVQQRHLGLQFEISSLTGFWHV